MTPPNQDQSSSDTQGAVAWHGEGLGVIERKRRISGHPRLLQTRLAPFSKVSVKFLAKQYNVILLLLSLVNEGVGAFERSTSGAGGGLVSPIPSRPAQGNSKILKKIKD